MKNIEVKILNPDIITDTYKMMAAGARLTQHSHDIKNLADFEEIYRSNISDNLISKLNNLPHPTLLHFTKINVVVVGASRRFLAQITRHQENVKFMSGSLQYSNFTDNNGFVIPYDILDTEYEAMYEEQCKNAMQLYGDLQADNIISNDAAGYVAPQSLRNVLMISATPFQWKHMISQRTCKRNTLETRYVMLLIWNELYKLAPNIFTPKTAGPFCQRGPCQEGAMSCKNALNIFDTPDKILEHDFDKIVR